CSFRATLHWSAAKLSDHVGGVSSLASPRHEVAWQALGPQWRKHRELTAVRQLGRVERSATCQVSFLLSLTTLRALCGVNQFFTVTIRWLTAASRTSSRLSRIPLIVGLTLMCG